MFVHVCVCELQVGCQLEQAQILALVINFENDYLFCST